jgi:ribosomal protein S6--L-glutamate ligase
MTKVRIGFLTRSFSPHTRSYVPLVMRALAELGALVEVVHPPARAVDLSKLRVEHDLYVLKQMSGLGVSMAGALDAQRATLVNPYRATLALSDKIVAFRMLQRAGISVPETYVATEPQMLAPFLDAAPLIVKPYRGSDGHGIRVISSAAELAELGGGKEPLVAQRYLGSDGPVLKMFSIGGHVFGVKQDSRRGDEAKENREPFVPTPEQSWIVRRCGEAFGIDLYGVDLIESEGSTYVVDVNSIPGFKGVPDAPLRLAKYFYAAAQRAAQGRPLVESALEASPLLINSEGSY